MSVEKCNRREKAVVIKAYMGQLVVTHQYQLCFWYCITHSLSHSGAEQRFVFMNLFMSRPAPEQKLALQF